MANMDDFNRGVALILSTLLESFPRAVHLTLPKLAEGASEATLLNYAATVDFLRDEGFIRTGNSVAQGLHVSNVTLTAKGLAILNSVPESVRDQTTLGDQMREVAKTGGKEALGAVIGEVVGRAAAAFTKAMGGQV